MDTVKQWIALAVAAGLAVLTGGWFLLIAPEHAEADALREQVASQEVVNAQVRTQLEVLRTKAEALPEKEAELARIAVKVPDRPGLPDLLRALSGAATTAGVVLTSVSPGPPAPVGTAAAPAAAAPAAPAAEAATSAAPAAPSAGLRAMPVTMAVRGSFHDVEQFLVELEDLPRALRITNLALTAGTGPDAGTGSSARQRPLAVSLTGEVYLVQGDAPAAPAAPTGATAAGPAPTPADPGTAAEPLPAAR